MNRLLRMRDVNISPDHASVQSFSSWWTANNISSSKWRKERPDKTLLAVSEPAGCYECMTWLVRTIFVFRFARSCVCDPCMVELTNCWRRPPSLHKLPGSGRAGLSGVAPTTHENLRQPFRFLIPWKTPQVSRATEMGDLQFSTLHLDARSRDISGAAFYPVWRRRLRPAGAESLAKADATVPHCPSGKGFVRHVTL